MKYYNGAIVVKHYMFVIRDLGSGSIKYSPILSAIAKRKTSQTKDNRWKVLHVDISAYEERNI